MLRDVTTCSVCGKQPTRGSRHQTGEVFVCVDCQADAKKFIEIQDDIWKSAGDTKAGELNTDDERPEHP